MEHNTSNKIHEWKDQVFEEFQYQTNRLRIKILRKEDEMNKGRRIGLYQRPGYKIYLCLLFSSINYEDLIKIEKRDFYGN